MKRERMILIPVIIAVLGLIMAIVGIGLWIGSKSSTAMIATTPQASSDQYIVSRPGVLELNADKAHIVVEGKNDVAVAVGRTTDVHGWVDGLNYSEITGIQADNHLNCENHKPDTKAQKDKDAQEKTDIPSPAQGDNWQVVKTGKKRVEIDWDKKEGYWSLLAYSADGPAKVSIQWNVPVSKAWIYILTVAGLLIMLVAIGWLTYALFAIRQRDKHQAAADEVSQDNAGITDEISAQGGENAEENVNDSAYATPPVDGVNEASQYGVAENSAATGEAGIREPYVTGSLPKIDASDYAEGRAPSRRELREARRRGEATVTVGDKEFPTGLIPIVTELPRADHEDDKEEREGTIGKGGKDAREDADSSYAYTGGNNAVDEAKESGEPLYSVSYDESDIHDERPDFTQTSAEELLHQLEHEPRLTFTGQPIEEDDDYMEEPLYSQESFYEAETHQAHETQISEETQAVAEPVDGGELVDATDLADDSARVYDATPAGEVDFAGASELPKEAESAGEHDVAGVPDIATVSEVTGEGYSMPESPDSDEWDQTVELEDFTGQSAFEQSLYDEDELFDTGVDEQVDSYRQDGDPSEKDDSQSDSTQSTIEKSEK